MIHQVLNPQIRHIKVMWIDSGIIFLPGITGLVCSARIKGRHVRIKPRDNLDDRETFLHAVRRQGPKIIRPIQTLAKPHPPRIPQPEERCTVLVLEVQMVTRYTNTTMRDQRVATPISRNLQHTMLSMQVRVGSIT